MKEFEDETSALMETKLRALLRESKNNAKAKKDKKEYLRRHQAYQEKKVEDSLKKLREDQNKLLRQITSLQNSENSRKRKTHYSDGESEEADEDEISDAKRLKTQKKQVSTPAASSSKAKKKKAVEEEEDTDSSEIQLMKYLQSLQK